jgi:Flp pilus assembly protein TadG
MRGSQKILAAIRLRGRYAERRSGSARAQETKSVMGRLFDDKGASLIEFALSASVLFLALLGIIEMCLALYIYDYVSDAARVGTRYAMVRGSNSDCTKFADCNASAGQIQSYLRSLPYPGMNASNLTATVIWYQSNGAIPAAWTSCNAVKCNAPQNEVQVTVIYAFPLHIPYFPSGTINIRSTSQTVISN